MKKSEKIAFLQIRAVSGILWNRTFCAFCLDTGHLIFIPNQLVGFYMVLMFAKLYFRTDFSCIIFASIYFCLYLIHWSSFSHKYFFTVKHGGVYRRRSLVVMLWVLLRVDFSVVLVRIIMQRNYVTFAFNLVRYCFICFRFML